MIGRLRDKLRTGVEFPSPPAVAQQIVTLASDPEIDVNKVAAIMSKDPGLTAKILRVANSPIYSKQRKSDNLRQALIILGLNTATNLALSFSLVAAYRSASAAGIDYTRYWRRAILSATAARALGHAKRADAPEDLFLAALLQDIAILAIDRAAPDFYAALPYTASHAEFSAYETSKLGQDHAAMGAWLLRHWRLPDFLCRVVELSHSPTLAGVPPRTALSARCIALGSECAEMLTDGAQSAALAAMTTRARTWLSLSAAEFSSVIERAVAEAPELEQFFDTSLLQPDACTAILAQARDLLEQRNPTAEVPADVSQSTSETVVARTLSLADMDDRDPLTCAFHRQHMEATLQRELSDSIDGNCPLTLLLIDLDRLRRVNDCYGHPAGDAVLFATARLIKNVVGDTGYVARYGAEEFAVMLPRIGIGLAKKVAERILLRLRNYQHAAVGRPFVVTGSLGLAAYQPGSDLRSTADLLKAAETALVEAKAQGRDRLVCHSLASLARTG